MSAAHFAPDYFSDWRQVITLADPTVFAAAGYGGRLEIGRRPALLVIDSTYAFVGVPGASLATSMETYRLSCGPPAWKAIPVIHRLLDRFRAAGLPTIYSAAPIERSAASSGLWLEKSSSSLESPPRHNDIVDEIAPTDGDLVIRKTKPSVFHGTPLVDVLIGGGVDLLVIAGGTTSGCVRATAVDAFSMNFPVFVVEDGVFDRAGLSHAVSLFDMSQKDAEAPATELLVRLANEVAQPATA